MKNVLVSVVCACLCLAVYGDGYGGKQFWQNEPSLHRHGAIGLYPNNINLAGNYFQYQAPKAQIFSPKKTIHHKIGGKGFNGYGNSGPKVGGAGLPVMPVPYHGYGGSSMGFSGAFDPYYVDPRPSVPETLDYLVARGGEFVKKNWKSLAMAGAGLYLLKKN
ncbi:uncharacterized protein [Argopecten irradians]|uniref:uncharacterized protein n=1 Tax=Argopecten irradians TaxID=31199 RepID=UPI00371D6380